MSSDDGFSFPLGPGPVVQTLSSTPSQDLFGPLTTSSNNPFGGLFPTQTPSTTSLVFGIFPTPETTTRSSSKAKTTAAAPSSSRLSSKALMSTFRTSSSPSLVSTTAAAGVVSTTSAQPSSASSSKAWIAAAVIVPVAFLALLALALLFLHRKRRQRRASPTHRSSGLNTRSSTGSAGLFHTSRSSTSDMEKIAAEKAQGPVVTKPVASVQHNYLSGVDISGPSTMSGQQDRSLRPMASFAHTNSRAASSGGMTPMTAGSNPFTEGSNGAPSFSGFSGFGGGGGGGSTDNHKSHNEAPPPAATAEEAREVPAREDADDDALSITSEAEVVVQEGEVARVGTKQRASVVMMGGNTNGSTPPRRPS